MFHALLNKLCPMCGVAVRACLCAATMCVCSCIPNRSDAKESDDRQMPQHFKQPPSSALNTSKRKTEY